MDQQLSQQQQILSYQQQLERELQQCQQQYLQLQQCQQQHSRTISVQSQQQYGQESNYSPYYHQDIIPSTPRNYYQQQKYPHSTQRTVSTSSFTPPSNNQQYQQQQYPHSIQRSVSTPSFTPSSNSSLSTFNINNNNNINNKIQPQIMAEEDEKKEFIEEKPQTIDPKQTIPTFKQLSTYKAITIEYCEKMNLPKPIEVCIENEYWNICWDYLSPKGCKRTQCEWTHIDLNDSQKQQFSTKNRSRFIAKVRMKGCKTTSGDGSSKINAIYNAYKKMITSNIVPWQSVNKCESETKQKSQQLELENDDKHDIENDEEKMNDLVINEYAAFCNTLPNHNQYINQNQKSRSYSTNSRISNDMIPGQILINQNNFNELNANDRVWIRNDESGDWEIYNVIKMEKTNGNTYIGTFKIGNKKRIIWQDQCRDFTIAKFTTDNNNNIRSPTSTYIVNNIFKINDNQFNGNFVLKEYNKFNGMALMKDVRTGGMVNINLHNVKHVVI